MIKCKIKKNDNVIVITGKSKGQKGKVLRVFPRAGYLLIEGVNMVTYHQKQTKTLSSGRFQKESKIHISNVALFDEKMSKPTKVAFIIKDGKKLRISKKSNTEI